MSPLQVVRKSDAINLKQDKLGYTPVQQGGGSGQGSNKVYIGWSGTALKAQVDAVDMGSIITTGSGNVATVSISKGGTGATSASSARSNLGITPANIGAAASSHTHDQYYDSNMSRTANTVLSAPNGSAGSATFRKLTTSDLPISTTDINSNSYIPTSALLYSINSSLKSSVSNGKSSIASAITDKGVSTSATDSFSTMASNIRAIPSGSTIETGTSSSFRVDIETTKENIIFLPYTECGDSSVGRPVVAYHIKVGDTEYCYAYSLYYNSGIHSMRRVSADFYHDSECIGISAGTIAQRLDRTWVWYLW